jgi:hypothetical protein
MCIISPTLPVQALVAGVRELFTVDPVKKDTLLSEIVSQPASPYICCAYVL